MPDDRSGPAPGSARPHGKRRRGHGHGPGPLTTPASRPEVTAGPTQRRRGADGGGPGIPWGAVVGLIGLVIVVVVVTLTFLKPFSGKGGAAASATPSRATHGCPTSQPAALAAGQTRTVTMVTQAGTIVIKLEADLSPIAVGNFAALVSCGFYDGTVFHRVVPNFVIQGGDPTGTGRGGPGYTIQDEVVSTTYHRGTVAMARSTAANSVGSQFFIVLDDKAATQLASVNTYQIIGTVQSGMDVADAVAAAADKENPTNPVGVTSATIATP